MRAFILFFLNNIIVNRILIWIGQDHFIKRFGNDWSKHKLDQQKSMQENVGFSHLPEVDKAVEKIHDYINSVENQYLKHGNAVLDIGCGVGLYLKDFKEKKLYGTDLNTDFINVCKQELPEAQLKVANYNEYSFPDLKFDLIYSISVIEYVPPSKIQTFFDKIYNELNIGGIVAIQYPHALSILDKWYADLSYVSYLPQNIEHYLGKRFEILTHEHSFDKRKISGIDKVNYSKHNSRSFCNGMILIAQKLP